MAKKNGELKVLGLKLKYFCHRHGHQLLFYQHHWCAGVARFHAVAPLHSVVGVRAVACIHSVTGFLLLLGFTDLIPKDIMLNS